VPARGWTALGYAILAAACTPSQDETDESLRTLKVSVSAYCLQGKTASGLKVRTGIAAADPRVLPIGSVIQLRGIDGGPAPREGVYTILDTGGKIRGRRIDLHVPSCSEATRFGRRSMVAEVVRHGWAPDEAPSKPERPSGVPWLPWRDGFRLQQPANDNTGRDSTDTRGRPSSPHGAARRDSRDAADAPSAPRR